jgi:hypothetical protein
MSDIQPVTVPQGSSDQQSQQLDILAPNQRTEQELLIRIPFYSSPVIQTEPAIQAYLEFKDEFLFGASGFTLLGQRGDGRKTALLVMRNLLRQEFPEVETVTWAPLGKELTTPTARWGSLLAAAGYRFWRGTPEEIKWRLLNLIDERTAITGVYRFVLFVQSVEKLEWEMIQALAALKTNLQVKGIQLFLVGTAEINAFKAMVEDTTALDRLATIRSLLGSGRVLRPLTSALDLDSVLREIDTSVYTEAGSVTWVQFLLPKACKAGFKLSDQAGAFKVAVDEYAANGRVTAEFIFRTIKRSLGEASKNDQPGLTIGVDQWKKAMGLVLDGIVYLPEPKEGN